MFVRAGKVAIKYKEKMKMIATIVYGKNLFEGKEEFQSIVEAIKKYDKNHFMVYFGGHDLWIGDGGIKVTLHYLNEPVPEFLRGMKPSRVTVFDSFEAKPSKQDLPAGVYRYGQATAQVETISQFSERSGRSRWTKIHIESKSARSAFDLLNKIRGGEIKPSKPWVH